MSYARTTNISTRRSKRINDTDNVDDASPSKQGNEFHVYFYLIVKIFATFKLTANCCNNFYS